jgi:hypothetical protein
MANIVDVAVKYLLHANNNQLLVGIILLFTGLFLLVFGISNGLSFAGLTCSAPNDSYRGLSVLVGVAAMVTAPGRPARRPI